MPRLRANEVPRLRLHKPSGRAVVTLGGRDVYCGPHGSEQADREYRRAVAEWLANGRKAVPKPGEAFTVARLCELYLAHAEAHYRKGGEPTSELRKVRAVAGELIALYGDTPAAEFGPLKLKAIRDGWIRKGLARATVNHAAMRLRLAFRWGVEHEYLPPAVLVALQAVRGLQKGRSEAPDHPPIGPVEPARLAAVLPLLPRPIAAMLRLMDVSGMRPAEVVGMRPCDVDRSATPWTYTVQPGWNKTEHRGRPRTVLFGPAARAILGPWLDAAKAPDGPVFRSPVSRSHYCVDWLRIAVGRAARRAGVPPFGPNALRHSAATRFRSRFGLDAAQVVLGHSDARTTEIYAELDRARAAEVVEQIG